MSKLKVFKVELCIIDFDELGEKEIALTIENNHYPNHCMSPTVMKSESREIDWEDDHPLNNRNTFKQAFKDLFNEQN